MGLNFITDENNTTYVPIGMVAKLVGKSNQTVRLWDIWSDELALNGSERLIPESTRFGKNQVRYWTLEEVDKIKSFSRNIKYGELSEFSRTRWGARKNNLKQDKSLEFRNATKKQRNMINRNSVKLQNEQKVQEIKKAKGDMIKAVRKRARSIYSDM